MKLSQNNIRVAAIVASGYVLDNGGDPIKTKTAANGWAFDWLLENVERRAEAGSLDQNKLWVAVVRLAKRDRLVRGPLRRAFTDEILSRQALGY